MDPSVRSSASAASFEKSAGSGLWESSAQQQQQRQRQVCGWVTLYTRARTHTRT